MEAVSPKDLLRCRCLVVLKLSLLVSGLLVGLHNYRLGSNRVMDRGERSYEDNCSIYQKAHEATQYWAPAAEEE
jgi:hypothetical protein